MYSRVRASGFSNGIPYQPSTTCGPDTPRPRMKRPSESMVHRHRRHRRRRGLAGGHLHDRRAELQALGRRAPPRQRRQAVGAVRLGRPDRVEAEALRLGDRLDGARRRARLPSSPVFIPSFSSRAIARDYSWPANQRGGTMAITVGVLSETRRRALEAVCDTFAPALEAPEGDEQTRDVLRACRVGSRRRRRRSRRCSRRRRCPRTSRRSASCSTRSPLRTSRASRSRQRTALVHAISDSSPEAKLGVRQLRALTFLFFYGLPDESGPQPQLGRDRLSGAGSPRRRRPSRRRRRSRSSTSPASRRRSRPTSASSARVRAAA